MEDTSLIRNAYGSARLTPQRHVIARTVLGIGAAFTVEDLAERIRAIDPRAGASATVYRAVAAMEAAGFVQRVGSRGGSALFVRCSDTPHHHHIVCDGCGRVAKADCPIGSEIAEAAQASGFVVTRHEVTFYGLCHTCAAKE